MCAQVVLGPLDAEKARQKSRFAIDNELRIALIGKTGVGKSATANTICGGDFFESGVDSGSMTKSCQQKRIKTHGKHVLVIDTPGIFDTEDDPDYVEKEIKRCVHIGAPGLHALLFVMEVGRFRQDDLRTINTFLRYFEQEMKDRVIIVLTHADKLLKSKQTLDEFIDKAPNAFKTFVEDCQKRIILFNNEFSRDESYGQVEGLLNMVDALKVSTHLDFYSDALFKKAEEMVQVREREIEAKLQAQYKKKYDETERSLRLQIEKEMKEERMAELQELKMSYEKKLAKVRNTVRDEISKPDSSCTLL